MLAALASPPATKALDPDPFPCRSLRHAVYAALLHFGLESAIEKTPLYKTLYNVFQKTRPNVPNATSIDRAPLAVMGSPPTSGIFPFDKFSSVTFLIDALNEDSANAERRLMLLPRTEVIGLKLDGKRVKSLDLKVGRDPKLTTERFNKDPKPEKWDAQTLQLGDKTTVVLANGTVEATRLALVHLGCYGKAKKR